MTAWKDNISEIMGKNIQYIQYWVEAILNRSQQIIHPETAQVTANSWPKFSLREGEREERKRERECYQVFMVHVQQHNIKKSTTEVNKI